MASLRGLLSRPSQEALCSRVNSAMRARNRCSLLLVVVGKYWLGLGVRDVARVGCRSYTAEMDGGMDLGGPIQ